MFRFFLAAIMCAIALAIATAQAAPIQSTKSASFDRAIELSYQAEFRTASLDAFSPSDARLFAFGVAMQSRSAEHVLMLRDFLQRLLMGLSRADDGANGERQMQLFVPDFGIEGTELSEMYDLPEPHQEKLDARQSYNWQQASQIPNQRDGKFARGGDRDYSSRNMKWFRGKHDLRPRQETDVEGPQVSNPYEGQENFCSSSKRNLGELMTRDKDNSANGLTSAIYGVINGLELILDCLL